MNNKRLNLGHDLREHIIYDSHTIPLSICIDRFDEYLNREWECHWHEEFEFSVLLQGSISYSVYKGKDIRKVIKLGPGDGIFLNSGTLHSAKAFEPGSVLACFVFPLAFFEMKPFTDLYRNLIYPIVESDVPLLSLSTAEKDNEDILSSMQMLCSLTEADSAYELHSLELICRIWRMLIILFEKHKKMSVEAIGETPQAKRMKQMIQYVHENYGRSITVDDIASSAGISRTECFRSFQALLETTPTEYLISYRISMASMLLSNTSRTLSDIAAVCGFSTPSYFGRQFRNQCGMTPGEFRKKAEQSK